MPRPASVLFLIFAFMVAQLIAFESPVAAHAVPDRASPPIDGVINSSPARLEIWFTEDVDPSGLTVRVIGPDGQIADQQDGQVDLNDPQRQHVVMSLLPNLGSGTYVVQWHAVSNSDGDAADGSFQFTIDPSATPTGDAASEATPESLADSVGDNARDDDAINGQRLGQIAVLLLIGLATLWVVRRNWGAGRRSPGRTGPLGLQEADPNTEERHDER